MTDPTPRSLEVRLTEYRDSLISVADQLDDAAATIVRLRGRDAAPLNDGAKLYRLVAADITKVIAGEELEGFMVTGEIL